VRKPQIILLSTAVILALGGCSAGSLGSSDGDGKGKVSLTLLVDNAEQTVATGNRLAKDFMAKNPDIMIKVETRPQGTDGDNLIKTRLATGTMDDLFEYNTGSLFQAMAPEKNLVSLNDQPWIGSLDKNFSSTVTSNNQVYAAPWGGFMAGGILYNRKVYDQLGLQVPKTWNDFMANNAKIKASGVAPVIQSYGETWTSQLFVLGDFHNVAAAAPSFAADYTANKAKYATTPAALEGFQHLQQVHDQGLLNKDFASAKLPDAVRELSEGKGAQWPILTSVISEIAAEEPSHVSDVGLFAIPGSDASTNGLTLWSPAGLYIPKSVNGAKLDAAKKFTAYLASPDGCNSQSAAAAPTGPFAVKGCTLPASVPQVVKDMQTYIDAGNSSLALEFLSPVKGPSLEQICVEVGSGIRKADAGAALYDEDVKKQAQQLGLAGW
jgi:raffinose/stachyose/melibiose transport system substrate-binding protein